MIVDFDEYHDLDWFATDQDGLLVHFATGGKGAVPLQLLSNRPHLQAALAVIRSLPQVCEALISPDLEKHVTLADTNAEAQYLRSFVAMAQRGLFSFDCDLSADAPAPYFLVAKPDQPLTLDALDAADRRLIELIQLPLMLWRVTHLDVTALAVPE